MKTTRTFFMLIIVLSVLSQSSCKTIERVMYNIIRANVDSKLFTTQVISGTAVAGRITLAGSTTTGSQAMTVIVPAGIQTGTYKLTSSGSYLIEYKAASNNIYAAVSGDLIITSHDTNLKKLKGTFSFKGQNLQGATVDVTNGSFSVSYF